jgi:hypothetical protein
VHVVLSHTLSLPTPPLRIGVGRSWPQDAPLSVTEHGGGWWWTAYGFHGLLQPAPYGSSPIPETEAVGMGWGGVGEGRGRDLAELRSQAQSQVLPPALPHPYTGTKAFLRRGLRLTARLGPTIDRHGSPTLPATNPLMAPPKLSQGQLSCQAGQVQQSPCWWLAYVHCALGLECPFPLQTVGGPLLPGPSITMATSRLF